MSSAIASSALRFALLVSFTLSVACCGGPSAVVDSGVLPDASPQDASPQDTGPSDTGPSDADAGMVSDASCDGAGACATMAGSYVTASSAEAGDLFGSKVSLSSDGTRLAVGAPSEASSATGIDGDQADNSASYGGTVYVFSRSGTTWTQEQYVKASNTESYNHLGYSVSLSSDGTWLAAGATGEPSNAAGVGGELRRQLGLVDEHLDETWIRDQVRMDHLAAHGTREAPGAPTTCHEHPRHAAARQSRDDLVGPEGGSHIDVRYGRRCGSSHEVSVVVLALSGQRPLRTIPGERGRELRTLTLSRSSRTGTSPSNPSRPSSCPGPLPNRRGRRGRRCSSRTGRP